ncbi:MAG: TetR family transcriptional regulator [Pseudomonadota bacterium]
MPRLNMSEAQTRVLILDEAERLFTEIGFEKTTIADIARACGFSSANVHRVYGTKHAINCAAAERKLNAKLQAARGAVAQAETAVEKLKAFTRTVHALTATTIEDNKRVHEMVAKAIEERWDEVSAYRLELVEIAREIIALGVQTGEFNVDDVDVAARAFHVSAMSFFHPLAVADMMVSSDSCRLEEWLPQALRGLGATPEAPANASRTLSVTCSASGASP